MVGWDPQMCSFSPSGCPSCRPPVFHTTAQGRKRAYLRVPADQNRTKEEDDLDDTESGSHVNLTETKTD